MSMLSVFRRSVLLVLAAIFAATGVRGDDVLVPEILHGFTIGLPGFETAPVPGGDGNFYGVTRRGGKGEGAVYQVTPAGVVTVLAEFGDPQSEARGRRPNGPLAYDGNGKFYGVTDEGGRFENGTVFRVSQTGVLETLVDFSAEDNAAAQGEHPTGGLTLGNDGNFYGTTRDGGIDHGTVFRVSPQGRFESLANFTGARGTLPGESPNSQLLLLPDGSLAGLCDGGGRFGAGTVFVIDTTGKSLRSFSVGPTAGPDVLQASNLVFSLVCTADGTIYGLYYDGSFTGHVWQLPPLGPPSDFKVLDKDGNGDPIYGLDPGIGLTSDGKVLVAFNYDNAGPGGGLSTVTTGPGSATIARLGPFPAFPGRTYYDFGTASIVSDGTGGYLGTHFGILYRSDGTGGITTLASPNADGGSGLGVVPAAPVVFSPVGAPDAGTLYGYCREGGANDSGTLFKLPPAGSLSVLTALPQRLQLGYNNLNLELTPDGAGNLVFPGEGTGGAGAILKADASGIISEKASFDFSAPPNNFAQDPYGRLTPDGAGGFYGLAQPMGSIFSNPTFAATVFHLTSGNALLHVADVPKSSGDGNFPVDGHLTLDSLGNLFGTYGSYNNDSEGFIYKVTPAGVYGQFANLSAPANLTGTKKPVGPLVREGMTNNFIFPAYGNSGDQLLRLTAAGTFQKLFFFDSDIDDENFYDRNYPVAPLVQTNDGTIYGIMAGGGDESVGFLYRLTASGQYTTLYSFKTGAAPDNSGYPGEPGNRGDRNTPGLTLGPDGLIYGVAGQGGPAGGGTLFRFATAPQATGMTSAASGVTAHGATLNGSLINNGFAGKFWVTGGIVGGPSEGPSDDAFFTGFTGTQSFSHVVTDGLKGHRDYEFQFHAIVGSGADAVAIDGATLFFTTPNGAPEAQNDNILVGPEGEAVTGDVLRNDSDPSGTFVDPDGDPLAIASFTQGTYGSVTQVGNKLVYTPSTAEFFDPLLGNGKDSFTYSVTDNYPGDPLTSTATVNVLFDSTIVGEYAGLLFETTPAAAIIPAGAAGFARFVLTGKRQFSARFEIGGRIIVVKGTLSADHDTEIRSNVGSSRLLPAGAKVRSNVGLPIIGTFHLTPYGAEGRLTVDERTFSLRAGQAALVPKSDFTMRFSPTQTVDPIVGDGSPAGSGFAVVRQSAKARATLVGVLPDGTAFSKGSIVAPILNPDGSASGDKQLPFFVRLYRDKTGSFDGQLLLTATDEVKAVAGTTASWKKTEQEKDKRFANGFATSVNIVGGKYTQPASGQTPLLDVGDNNLLASFDRGGLFAAVSTRFNFNGASAKADADPTNTAHATVKFDRRSGLLKGTLRPAKSTLKYRGVVLQAGQTCAGYFLGPADAGSVDLHLVPP
jgi:uncharacterized repeat protein (TIGR03803 family)